MIIISNKLKVNNLCKNNLCVVTDFDKTITSYNSNSSLGVFSKFLPKKYEKEKLLLGNIKMIKMCKNTLKT